MCFFFRGGFCLAQVDNKYVLKKLQVLLLAVARKDWYRLPSEDEVKDDVRAKTPTYVCTYSRIYRHGK